MKNNPASELILQPDVRQLLDAFAGLMGLQAVFFDAEGREIERGRDAAGSEYCRLMQSKRFGLEACRRTDRLKQRECAGDGKILLYTCHAGLGEIIAPVKVSEITAGFIMLGQFRVRPEPPEFKLTPAESRAYARLPLLNPPELDNLIHMLRMLIEYIVAHGLVGSKPHVRLLQLEQYVKRNLANPITLRRAARHLACSESTLTHFLRRECNTSFCRFVTARRIDAAEQLLRSHPELTLAEIAGQCGFRDYHYFSRVFKALRGCPPGSLRR